MATLPQLVSAITEVDGRDRAAIDYAARVIREAGFISTAKRGGGAAEMDFTAAANLLIGLNGADSPKDTPAAISVFRTLKASHSVGDDLPDSLRAVSARETFGEALEEMIERAPELARLGFEFIRSGVRPEQVDLVTKGFLRGDGPVRFIVEMRRFFARMTLHADGLTNPIQWEARFYLDPEDTRFRSNYSGADRRVRVEFSLRTLLTLWCAVAGEDETEILSASHSAA